MDSCPPSHLIQLPSLTHQTSLTLGFQFPKHSNHILTLEPVPTLWNVLSSGLITGSSSHPFSLFLIATCSDRPSLTTLSRADPNIFYFSSCFVLSQHSSELVTVSSTSFLLCVVAKWKFRDGRFVLSCLLLDFKHKVNPCFADN